MKPPSSSLNIVMFGLSITSAWGNGHATTYRSLVRALAQLGHRVTFFERHQPWYSEHRDLPEPPWCKVILYNGIDALEQSLGDELDADLVMIGSFVPDGAKLARWLLERARGVTAFYDIDTPVTMAALQRGDCGYLDADLVSQFDLYLSFAGGPVLEQLETQYGARRALPLYCSVDPELYYPQKQVPQYDLAYLGTYSADRQPKVELLLNAPAREWSSGRFCVAGAQYPSTVRWAANVQRIEHLPPHRHCSFYNAQRFTLNVTRADMVASGYSPSVRLFEAAACGVPIISDCWNGLEDFFEPGSEILLAESAGTVLRYLRELDAAEARTIGMRARARVLAKHTAADRARQLERYVGAELALPRVRTSERVHTSTTTSQDTSAFHAL
jgi:spore maturation protein CgeB